MIALSYRREDSLPIAGRLYDRLQTEFGKGNVFMDFDSIPYGVDFREHIKQMIDQSKVLVALIGPDWVGKRRHQSRRIDDPADFVRLEIAYALNRKLPIIPVLVSNAQMPSAEQLPKDIEELAFRNAISLDAGIDFHHHAERLAAAINRLLAAVPPRPPEREETRPQEIPAQPHVPLVRHESQLEAIRPASAPIAKKSLSPELVRTPSIENRDEAQDRPTKTQPVIVRPAKATPRPPIIDWRDKVRAIRTALSHLWETAHATLLATKSRVGHFFYSIQTSAHRCAQTLIDQLRRNGKIIGLSAVCLLGVLSVVGTVYWGLRSGTFQLLLVQTSEFFKSKSGSTAHPAPTVLSRPQQAQGALAIDSTPQGEAFEVIDAEQKHHVGKTPSEVEDLPVGYAQVIFRREGFSDHAQTVWIAVNSRPSTTWDFPETYRVRPAAAPTQNETPTAVAVNEASPSNPPPSSPTMNPAAQNGRPWQIWIGDFVRQFVIANESPDPNPTLTCYAPTVSYFDEKNQDQAYIRQDIERYNMRWPIRHDEIEGDIHLQEKVPGQRCLASFKLNFYAESPPRNIWTKGQFAIDLEITLIDGLPKITAIREKTLHQQKGRPGVSPNPSVASKSYPNGIPVQGKPGIVRSPYAPAKGEIDIRRYAKGAQVRCPFTGKIFIAP